MIGSRVGRDAKIALCYFVAALIFIFRGTVYLQYMFVFTFVCMWKRFCFADFCVVIAAGYYFLASIVSRNS